MADQQSAEEALAIVRRPATGVTLESHGLVQAANDDGQIEANNGTMRLDRATVVASMKRHGVIKGTSQHLTQVLRMVADCGGLPQFNQAVADAEGARLRLIYFIAKAKPCFDAVGEPDLRSEVLAEVGRMLKPN